MPKLLGLLELNKCPHCNVDKPSLANETHFETSSHDGVNKRFWRTYSCHRCGGAILAASQYATGNVTEMYPEPKVIHESIPTPASQYLTQAMESLHSPAGSVMLSASAVDAMLKAKSYKDGTLFSRIDQAAKDHLITEEMALWAHEVRLDANDQRHADEDSPLPTDKDAKRSVEFTLALAEFLFVLPSRVTRGRKPSVSDGTE
jgi:hypothetical protein